MSSAAPSRQVRLVGPFQQLVMIALVRLGPDTSARDVRRHIEHSTGRRISITAVHTTLQRLGARGYTASWTRPIFWLRPRVDQHWWKTCPKSLLCNAARRFHTLQTAGRRALRLTLAVGDELRAGLPGMGREEALYPKGGQPLLRSPWDGLPINRRFRKLVATDWELKERLEILLAPPRIAALSVEARAAIAWREVAGWKRAAARRAGSRAFSAPQPWTWLGPDRGWSCG